MTLDTVVAFVALRALRCMKTTRVGIIAYLEAFFEFLVRRSATAAATVLVLRIVQIVGDDFVEDQHKVAESLRFQGYFELPTLSL